MAGQKQTPSSFSKNKINVCHSLAEIDDEFPIMINDQPIPRVHSISCSGVKLDETLNWEEHL